jgi:hypothetical protein
MKQTNKLVTKKFTFISKYSKLTEENMEHKVYIVVVYIYIYIYRPNFENYFFVYN